MHDYQAAIRKIDEYTNIESWTLTDDVSKIASANEEDLIFATCMDELRAELNNRLGLSKSGLPYTYHKWHASIELCVSKLPVYDGSNFKQLQDLLAVDGEIYCPMLSIPSREKLRETDVVLNGNIARLDAKRAKARRKGAATRAAKKPITFNDLRGAGCAAIRIIHRTFRIYHQAARFGSCNAKVMADQLVTVYSHFDAIFGKDAHRSLAWYADLHKQWVEKTELNAKTFEGTAFCVLMQREVKEPLPPSKAEDEWKYGLLAVAPPQNPAS